MTEMRALTSASLDWCHSFASLMKSFIATALAVVFHIIGFAVGAGLWCAIGFGIGSAIGYPVTGALSGLSFQLAAYLSIREQMLASLERGRMKFLLVLDRAFV